MHSLKIHKLIIFSVIILGIECSRIPATPKRPSGISRSKSDISHRFNRPVTTRDDIEKFFETNGLDSSTWDSLKSTWDSSASTPPHYFDSSESVDSGAKLHMLDTSSDKEEPLIATVLPTSWSCNSFPKETSVVERNARIIKWLYNCRKALEDQTQ